MKLYEGEKRIEIYVDESGCDISLQPLYSWQYPNKKNLMPLDKDIFKTRLHFCCAISPQLGLVGIQVLEKSWCKEDYTGFIYNMIKEKH